MSLLSDRVAKFHLTDSASSETIGEIFRVMKTAISESPFQILRTRRRCPVSRDLGWRADKPKAILIELQYGRCVGSSRRSDLSPLRRYLRCLSSVVRRWCKANVDGKPVSGLSYYQTHASYLEGRLPSDTGPINPVRHDATSERALHTSCTVAAFATKRWISCLGHHSDVWKST